MKIRMRCLLVALALAASVNAGAASGELTLRGTVIDLGIDEPAPRGIAGVAITVRNAAGRSIATGLSDAQGRYEIALKGARAPLTLYFEKLGYQLRPTECRLAKLDQAQPPVEMIREAAPSGYYRIVAARAADPALPAQARQQRVAMVVELPPGSKAQVVEEVRRLAAVPALEQIQVAEKSKAMEANVKSKLLADTTYPSVKVNADADSGVVQLSGVVESTEQKSRASALAQSVSGVKRVLNMLSIQAFTGSASKEAASAAKR